MKIDTVMQGNSGLAIARYNLKELLGHLDIIKLAFVPTQADLLIREKAEKYLKRVTINPNGVVYQLYHDGTIEVLDPPMSGSLGSAAKYYVWDDKTGLLLQFIPPYSKTSCNYHKKTKERFYNLIGNCSICFCEGKKYSDDSRKLDESPFNIKPYQCHQLYTSSTSAINMILMDPPNLGRSDHHYVEKCIKNYDR